MTNPATECHLRLQQAQILLDGTDQQRTSALALLREIARDHSGTSCAQQALEMIEKNDRHQRWPESDPELKHYEWRWREITGLTDARIVPLLKGLKEKPGIMARLRPRVVDDLRKWVDDILHAVSLEMNGGDLRTLENVARLLSEIDSYNTDEIRHLRNVLFGVRYQELSQKIRSAAAGWAVEESWKLFASLRNAPKGFQEQVGQLRDEIYDADGLRKTTQELISQSPKSLPAKWLDARVIADFLQKVHEFMSRTRMPDEWAARLNEQAQKAAGLVRAFLEKKAIATANLEDLKAFWAEHERIEVTGLGSSLVVEESWFQKCLDQILKDESSKVEAASSAEDLRKIGLRLEERAEKLPRVVSKQLLAVANEINHLTSIWRSMLAGHIFEEPVSHENALSAPREMKNDIVKYKACLDRVEAAFSQIESNSPQSNKQVYEEASLVAEEVLSQYGTHARAEELKKGIRQRLRAYELDSALRKLDIERFYDLNRAGSVNDIRYPLELQYEALNRLAGLARRNELATWREANEWWSEWRAVSGSMSDAVPDALLEAIKNQETIRADQLFRVLDAVKERDDLPPEEFQQVAQSLTSELEKLNLQGPYAELDRKAKVGFVSRFIAERRFDDARTLLETLDPDHHETIIRLRTRLEVEQAKAYGAAAMANALKNNWNNVKLAYGDEAQEVLLDAIQRSWEEDEVEALKMLRAVMGRVIQERGFSQSDLAELKRWDAWLNVEDAIRSETSLLNVIQLVSYLKDARPCDSMLRKQVSRLVDHWRGRNDIKMLAWGYQAFIPIDASLLSSDPAEELAKRSDRVADSVLSAIKASHHPVVAELKSLQNEVNRERKDWKDLNDFLDSLHHRPEKRHRLSDNFVRAAQILEDLIGVFTSLDRLNEADLRQHANIDKLEVNRLLLRTKFDGFPIQHPLLKQVERLEPLQEVPSFEPRTAIVVDAQNCGSNDAARIYDETLFSKLSTAVRRVIGKFELAQAVKRPMWRKVSEECCNMVHANAGILLPHLAPPDLYSLADRLDALGEEDIAFAKAIDELRKNEPPVPAGGVFNPDQHLEYLNLIPRKPPGSKKAYRRFDRFASADSRQVILKQGRQHLPDWVQTYLDNGVPS